ncbi:MAG TPA: 1-(5-phosphoribosyl)-5-[(5-phosphoribosylamino)methylideneamino]imidazole-4-carboxamide isomerase [Bacillota bacterium]|nr:1-(5-phosphoribosyl)-5-[(5-phosphoribosylamino)methylideneamino]imidazole-4-carboxamide isomerase [Bacillota bacterium]HOK69223.1 1-(5-phosphoribosyl)-5-[(5-phosphoribosylamino)methylideneamino]imidazole-4-carboxamide isomerase [Bacillota bacterium]HPP84676.1 1-(5-phosphoribosyl)-5-[(5-phosphoribosylamino)methylideneamino]imidazole-4-carboxamide isomerase [Bacillota bacterium]
MNIYPAIDIIGGCVVRLTQGDYNKKEKYNITPVEAAQGFFKKGARFLHIVDLDGAKDGSLSNFDSIREVIKSTDMFVEVGGGIRDEERIRRYLSAGVGRVILGTAALKNFPFLVEMVKKYGDRIAVGVDAKNGFVAVDGWTTVSDTDSVAFCEKVRDIGVKNVIYTDIERDGAMRGANTAIYQRLTQITGLEITASGGISSLDDITALKRIGVSSAIIGKALYEGKIKLEDALRAAE